MCERNSQHEEKLKNANFRYIAAVQKRHCSLSARMNANFYIKHNIHLEGTNYDPESKP